MDISLLNTIKPLNHDDNPEAKSIQERLTEVVLGRLNHQIKDYSTRNAITEPFTSYGDWAYSSVSFTDVEPKNLKYLQYGWLTEGVESDLSTWLSCSGFDNDIFDLFIFIDAYFDAGQDYAEINKHYIKNSLENWADYYSEEVDEYNDYLFEFDDESGEMKILDEELHIDEIYSFKEVFVKRDLKLLEQNAYLSGIFEDFKELLCDAVDYNQLFTLIPQIVNFALIGGVGIDRGIYFYYSPLLSEYMNNKESINQSKEKTELEEMLTLVENMNPFYFCVEPGIYVNDKVGMILYSTGVGDDDEDCGSSDCYIHPFASYAIERIDTLLPIVLGKEASKATDKVA